MFSIFSYIEIAEKIINPRKRTLEIYRLLKEAKTIKLLYNVIKYRLYNYIFL